MTRPVRLLAALVLPACLLLGGLVACRTGDIAGNLAGGFVGGRTGDIARAAVGGFVDAQETVGQMNVKFSPEQEYYLGRAVAANALATYGYDPDEELQAYVRTVGAALVALSARAPGTYGGWHFAVLDTDLANGISGPGGFVLVTRGAVNRCKDEEELAGILAHEMAHVSLRHGEAILREGSTFQAGIGALSRVVAAAAGARETSFRNGMSKLFGDSVGDLVGKLQQDGYGRVLELEADREGTLILYDAGYDASAVRDYLEAAEGRGRGTWETHPGADVRIGALEPVVQTYGGPFDGGVGEQVRSAIFARRGR
mgnify:CR=1 FL=1